MCSLLVTLLSVFFAVPAFADPIDWVSPAYVLGAVGDPRTLTAQQRIIQRAQESLNVGPFTLTNTTVLPPTRDVHDYLSWAPYHWPNCNWCPVKKQEAAHAASAAPSPTTASSPIPDWEVGLDDPYGEGDDPSYPSPSLGVTDWLNPTPAPGAQRASNGRQGAAKKATKTTTPNCTPSPTKSLAPSATWTTCPYITRDGQVNPDVRTLPGPASLQQTTQLSLWHALASILAPAPADKASYAAHAADLLRTFFVTRSSAANPNVNYGQMVRGPGKQEGAYMGVLDWRGMVQTTNAVLLLRATRAPAWDAATDAGMVAWARNYSQWLVNSPLAQRASQSPNNHGSFYSAQLAAVRILVNDTSGAKDAIKAYFAGPFQNQIAKNGEQTLEAARTRPFHYRCFNLEAMIANAKLGDFLGVNYWKAKSKAGGTIQDAVKFAMGLNPGSEDGTELLPHVAAAAAAYGDAAGTYAAFLARGDKQYVRQSYWFYDQAGALRGASGRRR